MTATGFLRSASAAAPALVGALGLAITVSAAAAPDATIDLPAGVACKDFDLRIEITGGVQVNREFADKNGNPVRLLAAGKGSDLKFINLTTESALLLKGNGSVTQTRFLPDGSALAASTGHNVIVLFPTDVPAGPSTTLFVGRVTYTIDPSAVFTLRSVSGKTTDICGALG